MKTYINQWGKPIIRSCANCVHFKTISHKDQQKGFCHKKPLMFAYTMKKSVYCIVKSFYLCEDHEFLNEQELKTYSREVNMKDILLSKDELHNQQ